MRVLLVEDDPATAQSLQLMLESESMVRVVKIELDEGEVVTVPRANVEIIEE